MVLADDVQRNVIGEKRQRLNVFLNDSDFERSKRESLVFEVSVDVHASPSYVRGIVYQFDNDRTLAAQLRLRK